MILLLEIVIIVNIMFKVYRYYFVVLTANFEAIENKLV